MERKVLKVYFIYKNKIKVKLFSKIGIKVNKVKQVWKDGLYVKNRVFFFYVEDLGFIYIIYMVVINNLYLKFQEI